MELETNFENILLKKLIYSSAYFSKCMPILKKKYFAGIGNQELFNLIKDYYAEYRSIPSLTELVAKVKNVSNSEIRAEIIASLQKVNKTDEVDNITFMIDETVSFIRDAMYYEALQLGSDGLMKKDEALKMKAQQILEERAKVSVDTDLGLDFDDVDEMIKYYSEKLLGIKTQHKELNKRLGPGFLPGTLSVILASSGIGKSLLKTDIISGLIKQGKKVLLVSMEMSDKEMMKRVHSNALDLPINSLGDLAKSPSEIARLQKENPGRETVSKEQIISKYNELKLSGTMGKLFIKDYPGGSFSALMLEQLLDTFKLEQNIEFDIVFLDYLGIMKSDLIAPSAGLYSYVKSIVEEVRAVAKKKQLPLVSSSQLNRGAVNNTDASNDSVSDSLGTVQTADFMVFLLQDEAMKERNEIICKVTKNRLNGRTDTWQMNIDYEHMRFHDVINEVDANILITNPNSNKMDDFGLMTPAEVDKKATSMIKEAVKADIEIAKKHDKQNKEDNQNPFDTDIENLYKELGI